MAKAADLKARLGTALAEADGQTQQAAETMARAEALAEEVAALKGTVASLESAAAAAASASSAEHAALTAIVADLQGQLSQAQQ